MHECAACGALAETGRGGMMMRGLVACSIVRNLCGEDPQSMVCVARSADMRRLLPR